MPRAGGVIHRMQKAGQLAVWMHKVLLPKWEGERRNGIKTRIVGTRELFPFFFTLSVSFKKIEINLKSILT